MFPEPREQARAIGVHIRRRRWRLDRAAAGRRADGDDQLALIFFVNIPDRRCDRAGGDQARSRPRGHRPHRGRRPPRGGAADRRPDAFRLHDSRRDRGGLGSSQTLLLGAISIGLLIAFVARQARVANLLMPLRLFRSRQVSGANLVQALLVVGMFGMFFLGALYMQRILGYDALQVGLAYLPLTIVMGTMSFRFTGQLNLKYGPEATLVPAMIFVVAGLLWLARRPLRRTTSSTSCPR